MDIITDLKYLRQPCKEVQETDQVKDIAKMLLQEMETHQLLGLAANQFGVQLRIFAMRMDPGTPICLINPTIVRSYGGSELKEEACESLPGRMAMVRRPKKVRVRGWNQYWRRVKYELTGRQARVACHELDHLQGVLIIDRSEPVVQGNRKEERA